MNIDKDKNSKTRIIFFGTPEFAVASLDALVEAGYDIAAVVTMPDKTGGRGNRHIQSEVKKYALAHALPLLQPEKLKDEEFVQTLRTIRADLFIVIAFRMLPEVVWAMPPLGTINLHASLLPKYRGAAPINRAVMAGETETGLSTFLLKHEIDTGDVLMQQKIEIGPDEDAGSVHDRLMELGRELILKTVSAITEGTVTPVPQEMIQNSVTCPAPKIFRQDCRIDWNKSASEIHNHVRGLAPHPGAWTALIYEGQSDDAEAETLKILRTSPAQSSSLSPGQMKATKDGLMAGTRNGDIFLLTVQPAGKKAMNGSDWFRGLRNSAIYMLR